MNTSEGIGFFGSVIVDRVLTIDAWPKESSLGLIARDEILGTGGSAWNNPVNIRAIDPDIPLFVNGVVGQGLLGEYARDHLLSYQIDVEHLSTDEKAGTSYSIVSNSSTSGLRTHLHYTGACDFIGLRQIQKSTRQYRIAHLGYLLLLKQLEHADSNGELECVKALRYLQTKAEKVAIDIVSLDNNPERFVYIILSCLPYIDYLIINEVEAGHLVRRELRNEDGSINSEECLATVDELLRLGVRDKVIIHFPEGALAMDSNETIFCPSFDVPSAEIGCVVGAGDAFASATLYGLYQGEPLEYCLNLGNANARHNIISESCTDGVVSLETLKATIQNEALRKPVIKL